MSSILSTFMFKGVSTEELIRKLDLIKKEIIMLQDDALVLEQIIAERTYANFGVQYNYNLKEGV